MSYPACPIHGILGLFELGLQTRGREEGSISLRADISAAYHYSPYSVQTSGQARPEASCSTKMHAINEPAMKAKAMMYS